LLARGTRRMAANRMCSALLLCAQLANYSISAAEHSSRSSDNVAARHDTQQLHSSPSSVGVASVEGSMSASEAAAGQCRDSYVFPSCLQRSRWLIHSIQC
jgi:hypothetical protein